MLNGNSDVLDRDSLGKEAVSLARAILAGTVDLFTGVHELIGYGVTLDDNTLDCFTTLIGIDSEMDGLPIGAQRAHWHRDALREKDIEIARAAEMYRPNIFKACEDVIALYSVSESF